MDRDLDASKKILVREFGLDNAPQLRLNGLLSFWEAAIMYAIVQTGGKQYKVQPGDQVKVEKINGDPGSLVELDQVLAVKTDDGIDLGTPLIQDMSVKATILKTTRDRKIVVFKKKRRKGYHKKQGHRQWFTLLRIDQIGQAPAVLEMDSPAEAPTDQSPEA